LGIVLLLLVSWCNQAWAQIPQPIEVTTDKGIRLWAVENQYLPIIALRITFKKAGYAYDPDMKEGVAYLVSSLLDEGTNELSALEFQKALEDISTTISVGVSEDHTTVRMQTLTQYFPKALALLKQMLTEPAFEEEAMVRIKGQIATLRAQNEQDPNYLAGRAVVKALYGQHPYARVSIGTTESLDSLTAATLKQYVRQNFTQANMTVSIAGAFDPETLPLEIDKSLGSLPKEYTDKESVSVLKEPAKKGVLFVEEDFPQTVIHFGKRGPSRGDDDYYAAYIANHIIGGGGFESLLTKEVREKNGLAYSIYSYLDVMENVGVYKGRLATNTQQAQTARGLVEETLQGVRQHGITEQQLAEAKEYLIGSFPLHLIKNASVAAYLNHMQLRDLGINYLQQRNAILEAVHIEEVNRAIYEHFNPEELLFVLVGRSVAPEKEAN
jgi:zinc protease